MTTNFERFDELLRRSSVELHAANTSAMTSGDLVATSNAIADADVRLFFEGIDAGLIRLERGGKFNTWDRPKLGGRWSLLSRSKAGGWYNAEYLPQLAAYVDAILHLGYSKERVFFELPSESLQLDLAILDDDGRVVVLGEAKRGNGMLAKMVSVMSERFADRAPGDDSKKRGDESRQLAWRLWTVRAPYAWLIEPDDRMAYSCSYDPLSLQRLTGLPPADKLGLDHRPPRPLTPPRLA
jgi:hypothetical protein